jgi:hypothetical protein
MANYTNQIQATRNALNVKDPLVSGLVRMLAGAPTARGTSRAFAKGLNQTVGDINNTDYTAGYKGSQGMINSMAGALGLGGAGADVVGTMDSPDNSLVQQSMRAGAASLYSGAETQATQNAYQNRMSMMSNLLNAREGAFSRNQASRLQLAQLLDAAGLSNTTSSTTTTGSVVNAKADGKPVAPADQPRPAPQGKHWVYQNGKAVLV